MIFLLSRFINDDFNNTDTFSINNSSDTPTVVMSTVKPTSNPTVKPTVKPTMKPANKPVVRIKPRVSISKRARMKAVNPANNPKHSRKPSQKRRNKSNYKRNNQGDHAFYKSWKYVTNDNTKRANIQVPSGQYLLAICITAHVSYFISYHVIQ